MTLNKQIITFVLFFLNIIPVSSQERVSHTRYDYTYVSQQITSGCKSKMEQAKAIYRWLCDNISYDTSYSIYNADDCFDNKRGVCQAYCELFYRIAEPIGLETILVSGKTKEPNGKLASSGHMWLIVKTDQYHIFIDPTWGAGSVNGTEFSKNSLDDYSWFNVSPSWMIFTHFPNDPNMQMLDYPIDMSTFMKLPQQVNPYYGNYGFHAPTVLKQAMNGNVDLPDIYNNAGHNFKVITVPQTKTLEIGEFYDFVFENTGTCDISVSSCISEWAQGKQVGFRVMPTSEEPITLVSGKQRYVMLKYDVATPTQANWEKVAKYNPFALPEIKKIKGFSSSLMKNLNINEQHFYKLYKEGKVGSVLPTLYQPLANIILIDAPLTDKLHIGTEYNFIFKAPANKKMYLIAGNTFKTMDLYTDGTSRIQFTPTTTDDIIIGIEKEGNSYSYVILYKSKQ